MRQDPLAALANGLTAGFEIARKNREDFRKQQEHEQESEKRTLELANLQRTEAEAARIADEQAKARKNLAGVMSRYSAAATAPPPLVESPAAPPAVRLPVTPEVPVAAAANGPPVPLPGMPEAKAATKPTAPAAPSAAGSSPAAPSTIGGTAAPPAAMSRDQKIGWMKEVRGILPTLSEADQKAAQQFVDMVTSEVEGDWFTTFKQETPHKPGTQAFRQAYFDGMAELHAQMGTFDLKSTLDNIIALDKANEESKVREAQIGASNASAASSNASADLTRVQTEQLNRAADANQSKIEADARKAQYEAALEQAQVRQTVGRDLVRHLEAGNTKGIEPMVETLFGKGATLSANPGEVEIDGQMYGTQIITVNRGDTLLFSGPVDHLRYMLNATPSMEDYEVYETEDDFRRKVLVAVHKTTGRRIVLSDEGFDIPGVGKPASMSSPYTPLPAPGSQQSEQGAQNTSQTERELDPNVNPTTGKRWAEGDQFMYGKDLMKVIRDPQTGNLQAVPIKNTIQNRAGVPPSSNEPGGA